MEKAYDTVVIGAGVFGAWTAFTLKRAGQAVALLDAYGPANSRASSGGESRIMRTGYGADEIYTRWAAHSLALWREFCGVVAPPLFQQTGVLWLAPEDDAYSLATLKTFRNVGVRFERLSPADLADRYPQMSFGAETWGTLEPDAGVLMARRAVHTVVSESIKRGVEYMQESVATPAGEGRLSAVVTRGGVKVSAGCFVFACGPWLPKIFPDILRERFQVTRQEVFFFGVEAGDRRFGARAMPAWIDFTELVYGLPDLEDRGVKLAIDRHGPTFDPEAGERVVTAEGLAEVRRHLARRLPALGSAPVVETRVCQYENTSNGDFLIDRHPAFSNVWLVGGGSGHGFKHGPVVGEYVADMTTGRVREPEPRFALSAKGTIQQRAVY